MTNWRIRESTTMNKLEAKARTLVDEGHKKFYFVWKMAFEDIVITKVEVADRSYFDRGHLRGVDWCNHYIKTGRPMGCCMLNKQGVVGFVNPGQGGVFTNYWLAYAHALKLLKGLHKNARK